MKNDIGKDKFEKKNYIKKPSRYTRCLVTKMFLVINNY